MFIYLIVNHDTGKYYVGQHKGNNLKKYLQQKFHHAQKGISSSSRLYRSMRAQPDPYLWSIHALRSDIQTKPELDELEKDFIQFLKAQDPEYGYNICRGGEGFTGPHTEKAKKKVGESSRSRWSNPEYKNTVSASISQGHTGVRHTPETCQKISRIRTGSHQTEESKKKQRQNMLHLETLGKGIGSRKLWDDPDMRKTIMDARKAAGYNFSSEARSKIGEASKRLWSDPKKKKEILEKRARLRQERSASKSL